MIFPAAAAPRLASCIGAALCLAVLTPLARAQSESPTAHDSIWDVGYLLDHLPTLKALQPQQVGGSSENTISVYAHPHLGDFFHRDYLRVPIGTRLRLDSVAEFNTELETYFTHGLRHSAGNGLSRLRVGAKREFQLSEFETARWSVGIDFATPLSRPPVELNDGHRHTLPYLSLSRPIMPSWHLVGFTTVGADLLAHTALAANFSKNELHANSLTFATGVTREWQKFSGALTFTAATSKLISNEGRQVFGVRPDVLIPLDRMSGEHTRLMLTVGAHAVTGPDGNEFGVNGNLRVEFGKRVK